MQTVHKTRKPTAEKQTCGECALVFFSTLFVVLTFPLSIWFCIQIVMEYQRAVVFRMGKLRPGGVREPGIIFVLPCIDDYWKVDLRTVSMNIPPQEVLTKDSVTVQVDAVVYYRVDDPLKAIVNVERFDNSTRLLASTTLRNVLGTRSLAELLTERKSIAHAMQETLMEATEGPWGVCVERVEIKDVSLPADLQRAMATEAEASRQARAKVIAAEGEMNSARALKEASEVIAQSPGALQLRYLQTLNTIAAERNSTIVFPLPMELMRGFMK